MIQRTLILLVGVLIAIASANLTGGATSTQGRFSAHAVITAPNVSCAGVVLNQNHVLTAASCILNHVNALPSSNIFSVRVGWVGLYQNFTAIRLYVHELYNPGTFLNDIAVIRLNQNITFALTINAPVSAANVSVRIFPEGTNCYFASYLTTGTQSFINIPIMSRAACNADTVHRNRVLTSQLCAGSLLTTPSVCLPARGGGLYCNGELVGILSNSFACGQITNSPGIYTQVRLYNDWISEQFLRTDIPTVGPTPPPSFPHIPQNNSAHAITISIFLFMITFFIINC